ncbi:MAG TPA: DUF2061 domain-containing protein [Candidatus Blautia pullistercoris]|uniref:DUF2061 domain-containing protein n=1 Tax=Candidatus Blautia pullistercoris TaxID=2838499 RepID=A0A9D1VKW6_9FIRM|nr:DUF2061 domain-containing protein [Candidatus Blautia pullistercoris]
MIKVFLYNTKDTQKTAYIWNTWAAMLNSFQSVLILMVISRIDPVTDAGVFTIAFAIGNLMLTIGQYGIRQFQVSDVQEKYSFREYVGVRVITSCLMVIVSFFYVGIHYYTGAYDFEKSIAVFLICLSKTIDSVEDVFQGRLQQRERLDIGAKAMTVRLLGYIITFISSYLLTENLITASLLALLVSLFLCLVLNGTAIRNFESTVVAWEGRNVKYMFIECFPLFLAAYLVIYIGNAPKYAIDAVLSSQEQACFNYIFMPVFVIGLLSRFIYQPMIGKMALLWHKGELGKFLSMVAKQSAIMIGLTVFVLIGGFLLGIPALSIVYGVNLTGYKAELMVLLLGGGFLAYTSFYQMVLTVIRRQNWLIAGYLLGYVLFLLLGRWTVEQGGILGVSVFYTIVVAVIAVYFAMVILWGYKVRKKQMKST